MKKQGLWFRRFIFLLIFLFVMPFMGYHVVSALTDPIGTVNAVLYTVETVTCLDGWFVRDEVPLPSPSEAFTVQAETGCRLAKGDSVALTYGSDADMQKDKEIRALTEQLDSLVAIHQVSTQPIDLLEMDRAISDKLLDFLALRDTGLLRGLGEKSGELKNLLLERSYAYGNGRDISLEVTELSKRIDSLRESMGDARGVVSAPVSGVYCAWTDGYESVLTPELLDNANCEKFADSVQCERVPADRQGMGCISQGFQWYYAALAPRKELGELVTGKTVTLRVDGLQCYEARVRRISDDGEDGDDLCLLVLEGDRHLADLVSLRNVPAEILWESTTGIRVPREAVRLDEEGRMGVLCLVFEQQRFKAIDILLERDNYYLVAHKPGDSAALLPGDQVIVRGKGLSDGKVVR